MGPFRFEGLRGALFAFLCLWLGGLIFWGNNPDSFFQRHRIKNLPFGFLLSPEGGVQIQDFALNLVYFHGIQERLVPHPYRLDDQEKLLRHLLFGMTSGLSHGYSPVAFVLALPLLPLSGAQAYLIYVLAGAAGILLLFHFYLLPRVEHPAQLYALALCAVSVCLALTFALGQSAMITTSLLGFFWMLLQDHDKSDPWRMDLGLALLFWMLCLKPNVGAVAAALLLGARAWRPLVIGGALLALTWIAIAPFYGGWWTGLQDYFYLLNHYNNADFTPFMRRDYVPGHDEEIRGLFVFDRAAMAVGTLILLVLRWSRRITLSELFQGMIGIFLLFSPYLLPSEDWVLCLLVVEGAFFRPASRLAAYGKLLLLFGIMDLRAGMIIPWQINFELKLILFGWMAAEALWRRMEKKIPAPS
jgi:hypothetical protein